jgi:hypothetical protein
VGNGSIPPKGWNMSLMNYLAIRKARKMHPKDQMSTTASLRPPSTTTPSTKKRGKLRFPNPLRSMALLLDKENFMLLFYNAFLFAAFYDVTASIPSQFQKMYNFNELQIGLCYIPFGCGSMCAALTNGQLLDRNFARWCRKLGVRIRKGRNQDLSQFPIEKARLQIAIPASYCAAALVAVFGWLMDINAPLASLLVVLFFASFSMSVAFNVTSTLLVDFYPQSPATATAANNVVRCLLGAGATAVVLPMIDSMGRGWTFTFLTLFLVATSPMLWLVYYRGMRWRTERLAREELARKVKAEKRQREQGGETAAAACETEDKAHADVHGHAEADDEDDDHVDDHVDDHDAHINGAHEKKAPIEGNVLEMVSVQDKAEKEEQSGHASRETGEPRQVDEEDDDEDMRGSSHVTLSRTFSCESGGY